MANYNAPFNVPDDGAYHAVAHVVHEDDWFDMTIETGVGRVAFTSDEDDVPQLGQPFATGDRWAAPRRGFGFVMIKAEGGAVGGSMSTSGRIV